MILLGDFSICYGDQKGPLFKLYDSVLKIFNLCQMIKQPTRVTEFTSSVIDHILCNNPEKNCQSGVLNMGISDHFIGLEFLGPSHCSADRNGDSHIIMILSQPVFVLMLYCRVLSSDAIHTNCIQLLITKIKKK